MKQHGKVLASLHRLEEGRSPARLLRRLTENENLLLDVHTQLMKDVKAGDRITPASEWLLDNYYVIEEQIRTARLHLPRRYNRELPCLTGGSSAGLPRGIRPRHAEHFTQ